MFLYRYRALSQNHFCSFNSYAFNQIPPAIPINTITVQVSVPDPLLSRFQILVIAGAAHVEIRQYLIHGNDLSALFPHLEENP